MTNNTQEEVIGKGDIRRYRGKDDPRYDVNIEKAYMRWFNDARYFTRFIVGNGILLAPFMKVQNHIGLNSEYFPMMNNIYYVDNENALQQYQQSENQQYDFMVDNGTLCFVDKPIDILYQWIEKIKIGGYIILYLPDEDMYLRGKTPNQCHHPAMRNSFTICKDNSAKHSYNITDMVNACCHITDTIAIQKCDHGYRDGDISDSDQEKYVFCESACEVILQRKPLTKVKKVNAKKVTVKKAKSKTKSKVKSKAKTKS